MAFFNLSGCTVTINSVATSHGIVSIEINEDPMEREILNAGNTPYPTNSVVGKKAEGSVELQWDSAHALPDCTAVTVLAIAGITGDTQFTFSGNVRLSGVHFKADSKADSIAEGGFKFKTIDGAYLYKLIT